MIPKNKVVSIVSVTSIRTHFKLKPPQILKNQIISGFMVQARNEASDKTIGTFAPSSYRLMDCFDGFNNTVSHSNNKPKKE